MSSSPAPSDRRGGVELSAASPSEPFKRAHQQQSHKNTVNPSGQPKVSSAAWTPEGTKRLSGNRIEFWQRTWRTFWLRKERVVLRWAGRRWERVR